MLEWVVYIARDASGETLGLLTRCGDKLSPLEAELWAVEIGLIWAAREGWTSIIIEEMDAKMVENGMYIIQLTTWLVGLEKLISFSLCNLGRQPPVWWPLFHYN